MVSTQAAGRRPGHRTRRRLKHLPTSASPARAPGASRSPMPPASAGRRVTIWGRDAAAMRELARDAARRAPAGRRPRGRRFARAPTSRDLERLRRDPARDARAGDAGCRRRSSRRAVAPATARHLRQRHRTRHEPLHDRSHRRGRAGMAARDPLRPELCRRRRRRPADRGDAGRARRRRWRPRFAAR